MPGTICRPAAQHAASVATGKIDEWAFDEWMGPIPSCKVDIHLLFFAAPSNSRNIYRSSFKE
jgi:hypothetical protein